jgi:glycerophosphoryl diester phosphodiesterase
MGHRAIVTLSVLVAFLGVAPGTSAASTTDWMKLRTMNITHQGGEDEAPSGTMYAFARSMRLGADMLEVDIHTTVDGHVVVMHDGEVDRTTNGTGSVYEMTLADVQKLDAAYDFVPGIGTTTEEPESSYAFRGARTGDRPPPMGFEPEDFRIPTLVEVMRKYPQVPINIEIKGAGDEDVQSFLDNAESLAETLTEIGRTEGIIVASFNDAAIARFHELMPEIDLAPSIAETAAFKAARVPPGPGRVAFQVPITFGGVQVTDADFVESAHAEGLAVHVWLSSDPENDETYNQLLDWNVDAVMPAAPAAFERSYARARSRVLRVRLACLASTATTTAFRLHATSRRSALAGWARAAESVCDSSAGTISPAGAQDECRSDQRIRRGRHGSTSAANVRRRAGSGRAS